jgi:hypothetical protein
MFNFVFSAKKYTYILPTNEKELVKRHQDRRIEQTDGTKNSTKYEYKPQGSLTDKWQKYQKEKNIIK